MFSIRYLKAAWAIKTMPTGSGGTMPLAPQRLNWAAQRTPGRYQLGISHELPMESAMNYLLWLYLYNHLLPKTGH